MDKKLNKFKGLFITGTRSGYAPEQCDTTFTINELIENLEYIKEICGGDLPVYLYNDNGYTYGHINEFTMQVGKYDENKGVDFGEDE